MSWARFDDHFHSHPKVLSAGPHAAWMWAASIGYANEHLTNGAIPTAALPRLAMASPTVSVKLAAKLVEVGLWEVTPNGYRIHDFLDWNPSAEQVRAKRAEGAARVERFRKKQTGNALRNALVTTPPSPSPSHSHSPLNTNPSAASPSVPSVGQSPPGESPQGQLALVPVVATKAQKHAQKPDHKHAFTPADLAQAFLGGAQNRAALGAIDKSQLTRLYRVIDAVHDAKRNLEHVRLAGEYMRARPFESPVGTIGWDTLARAGWLLYRIDAAIQWHERGRPEAQNAIKPRSTRSADYRPCATAADFEADVAERERTGPINYTELGRKRAAALESRQ